MTVRSILAGTSPNVVVRSGGDVSVTGGGDDRVLANSNSRWGLQVARKGGTVQVSSAGNIQIQVPGRSHVTVYAAKSVEVHNIDGNVSVYAGRDVRLHHVHTVAHASAGGAMDLDCERVEGHEVKFSAGRDLRCYIKKLTDAQVMVNDLGGYWEATVLGQRIKVRLKADVKLRLKAGGDVTLVTDQEVKCIPSSYLPGRIEKPSRKG